MGNENSQLSQGVGYLSTAPGVFNICSTLPRRKSDPITANGGLSQTNEIVITYGQHRNEKSAAQLAPQVAQRLTEMGYSVIAIENPEKRTLLEVIVDNYQQGQRLRAKDIKKFLDSFEDQENNYSSSHAPKFHFHNYGLNRTWVDESEEEFLLDLKSFQGHPNLAKIRSLRENELAQQVVFDLLGDTCTLLEIPSYLNTASLSHDSYQALRETIFRQKTRELWQWYFVDTDIKRTQEEGLMGKEMVNVLTAGIEHLAKKIWKRGRW